MLIINSTLVFAFKFLLFFPDCSTLHKLNEQTYNFQKKNSQYFYNTKQTIHLCQGCWLTVSIMLITNHYLVVPSHYYQWRRQNVKTARSFLGQYGLVRQLRSLRRPEGEASLKSLYVHRRGQSHSHDLLFKFWDPLRNFSTDEHRDFV